GHPRVSLLRDAAPPPHGAGAGVAAALPGGALLEDSLPTAPGALGYAAPRPLHAAPLRVAGHRRRGGGSQPPRLPLPARLAAALRGIPLSPLRAPGARRYPPSAALGHRALACAGAGGRGLRHRPLRGLGGVAPPAPRRR